MSITTSTTSELLDRVAALIAWAEEVGLRGDIPGLWRRHDALVRSSRAHSPFDCVPTIDHLRLLEAEVSAETLRRILLPEILDRVEAAFARGGASKLWAELAPDRRRQVARIRNGHTRSVEGALQIAVLRFERAPSMRHIARSLQALRDLEAVRIQNDRLSPEDVAKALYMMEGALRSVLPVLAREFVATEVEERFGVRASSMSTWGPVMMPRSSRDDEVWTPIWEGFAEPSRAEVEPAAPWFEPHAQARYEERRHEREVEQAHVKAEIEDRRRTNEIEEGRRKAEADRQAAQERKRQELAAQKEKEYQAAVVTWAYDVAPNYLQQQVEPGLTVKSIPEPERSRRIRQIAEVLIRQAVGNGTRKDKKGQEISGT